MKDIIVHRFLASKGIKSDLSLDLTTYRREMTDKIKSHYGDLVNMKLNVARVLETTALTDEVDGYLSDIYKKLDKTTDSLESLLAAVMGSPLTGIFHKKEEPTTPDLPESF